jgi:glycosyltransferase involved in cell wall biosynthesis
MITYNHENFIKDAIEGILMQKTSFPIELIIGEDCSTDNTRKIVKDYEEKYPEIIFAQYSEKNLGMINNFLNVLQAARGKYIALCEGDDYWTDPLKLQKQVDFLEWNKEYSGCAHACEIRYIEEDRRKIIRFNGKSDIDLGYYLTNNIFLTTGSLIFKRSIIENYPKWAQGLFAGDFVLKYLILLDGKMKYFDDVMSVYNKGVSGSWSKQPITQKRIDKEYFDNLLALQKINELSDYKYSVEVITKHKKLFNRYLARSVVAHIGKDKFKLFISNIIYFRIINYKTIFQQIYKNMIVKRL